LHLLDIEPSEVICESRGVREKALQRIEDQILDLNGRQAL